MSFFEFVRPVQILDQPLQQNGRGGYNMRLVEGGKGACGYMVYHPHRHSDMFFQLKRHNSAGSLPDLMKLTQQIPRKLSKSKPKRPTEATDD